MCLTVTNTLERRIYYDRKNIICHLWPVLLIYYNHQLMTIISDAFTINIINDASVIVIDDSRVTLQIVAPLTDDSRGVIYNRNVFIVEATVHGLFDEASLCLLCTLSKTPSDLLTFWSSPFPPHTKIRRNNIWLNDILSTQCLNDLRMPVFDKKMPWWLKVRVTRFGDFGPIGLLLEALRDFFEKMK